MLDIIKSRDPLNESNCWIIIQNDHCLVIDPNEPVGPCSAIDERGLTPDYFFLTHEHCDHMGGLDAIRDKWPDTPCVLSSRCNEGILSTKLNMSSMMEVYLTFAGKPGVTYPPFTCREADIVKGFDSEGIWELDWMGYKIKHIYLPGHTPGSSGIFIGEELFFSGDYLIPGLEPVLRLPGGSEEDYNKYTLPFLNSLKPGVRVYPGHGDEFIL